MNSKMYDVKLSLCMGTKWGVTDQLQTPAGLLTQ